MKLRPPGTEGQLQPLAPTPSRKPSAGPAAQAQLAPLPEGLTTGLQPEELCQPGSYAVEQDLARVLHRLEGIANRHRAELRQWYAEAEVTPTLGALMALMRPLHGVPGPRMPKGDRRRLYGLGLQVPLRLLAVLTGRNKATVCDALKLGEERGFLARYANTRRVLHVTRARAVPLTSVRTRDGVERTKVSIHGVLYLTPAGAAWLDGRGLTEADLGERNVRLHGRRGRVRVGVLWDCQRRLRSVARWVARRFAEQRSHTTPEEEAPTRKPKFVVAQPVENSTGPPGEAVRPVAAGPPIGPASPQAPANAPRPTSAPPDALQAQEARTGEVCRGTPTKAGLSGGGALPPPGAKPPRPGYGPPVRFNSYLEREVERCWARHVVLEGGPPRRVAVRVYVHGVWTGDFREELRPGYFHRWSPALTAAEAYPQEWGLAGGGPAGAAIRAQLEVDFGLFLGPLLRRRFLEWERLRRLGEVGGCPREGCMCGAAPAEAPAPAPWAAPPRLLGELRQAAEAAHALAGAPALPAAAPARLVELLEEARAAGRALSAAVARAGDTGGPPELAPALAAARAAGVDLRDAADMHAEELPRRPTAEQLALRQALRAVEARAGAMAAWARSAAALLQAPEAPAAGGAAVPRTRQEAQAAWGEELARLALARKGGK